MDARKALESGIHKPYRLTNQILAAFFLLVALSLFVLRYGFIVREGSARVAEFYRTFYVFFAVAFLCIQILTFDTDLLATLLFLFISLIALTVISYSLNDFLTIRLFLYLGLLTAILGKMPWPLNAFTCGVFAFGVTPLQALDSFLGENTLTMGLKPMAKDEAIAFFFVLLAFGLALSLISRFWQKSFKERQEIIILNETITKLTVFSQSLQSYARTAEQQAAKTERLRISREMHDITGYMFTNIIAMMDAIISTGCHSGEKTSELCMTVRGQAQEGLAESRKALHLLRDTVGDQEQGIRAIFKIKTIFEKTTGVKVSIETGNLPSSFGDEIDLILYRVVQEGLTNALRHGHATRVRILLWIQQGCVQIIVLDNGSGATKIIKGLGLAGMEERISKMRGTVHAMNAPEGGFQLTVIIPLDTPQ